MPRTAPAVSLGSEQYIHVSYRLIDNSGDMRSIAHDVAVADGTDANIEALGTALAAITNASLYEIRVERVYGAIPDSSNAVTGSGRSDSVHDNIVAQLKSVTNKSVRGFVPAPAESVMVSGTDTIDGTSTDLAAYLTALSAMYASQGYSVVGARYSERREINEQVRF